ncbi:helix-turn-helix transcriptional regulator, partial [Bacteroidota bacterium]
ILEILQAHDSGQETLTLEQAVAFTGLKKQTIYNYLNRGFIPYYKSAGGRKLYFDRSELLAWMKGRKGDYVGDFSDDIIEYQKK